MKKPELAWLKLSELEVDDDYQRSTNSLSSQKNIRQITGQFNWAYFGAVVVAKNDRDKYSIIDGQHRVEAARALDEIEEVPCIIVLADGVEAEAKTFSAINKNRVSLNGLAQYHAGIVAGDPDCLIVDELLQKANIEVPRNPVLKGQTGSRQTQAVGTLKKMLGLYSEKTILKVLNIIPEAYGDEMGQLLANNIKAVAHFYQCNEFVDDERVMLALMEIDLNEIAADARAYVRIEGGKVHEAMARRIQREYDKAKRSRSVA